MPAWVAAALFGVCSPTVACKMASAGPTEVALPFLVAPNLIGERLAGSGSPRNPPGRLLKLVAGVENP